MTARWIAFFLLTVLGSVSYSQNPTRSKEKVPCQSEKLDLSSIIITNESRKGHPEDLFDEQKLAGDPATGKGGDPKTVWFPGWDKPDHPASIYIDLRNPALITSIYLRDLNNRGYLKIEAGEPGNWRTVVADSLKGFQTWNHHRVNFSSQYLRFTRHSGGSNVSEVVLYGCMLPDGGAPAAITDLRVNLVTDESVKLLWRATGDDGKTAAAHRYEIRYSTNPISTEVEFKNAFVVQNELVPRLSGTVQSYLVRGLKLLTKYYFAMKIIDEIGNESTRSNSVAATTLKKSEHKPITMDKFIGINAFVDDPIDKVKVAGFVREYHNWKWDEGGASPYAGYPKNRIKWAPSAAGDFWNFDNYYAQLKKEGIEVAPVIQGNVNWLQGRTDFPFDAKPLDEKSDKEEDPNSYEAKAHHLFQFAARYGRTPVSAGKLTLDSGQPKHSGLGLIRYIEDWNEPNKYWMGPDAQFSPQAYAAMASADYDGHAKTMKQGTQTFGIKHADPSMKFVMGGIATIDIQWIEDIQHWFENNRPDNAFIPDVINVHHYSWMNGKNWQGGGPPKSPEEDNFKERMKAVVDYRDKHFPNVEVWISEFGWDTNPGSPLCPPVIGPFDVQEVQAQWLVRAYLAFAAAGVDRAQMYMLRDVNSSSSQWFSSSGLTGQKGDWTPKKSWYYVYTLKHTLTNMIFLGEERFSDPNIMVYKFKDVDKPNGVYVVWSKTRNNYEVKGYTISLSGNPKSAVKVELTPGDIDGNQTDLTINLKSVSLDVSERPVFILVDDIQ